MMRTLHPGLAALIIVATGLIAFFTVNGFADSATQPKPHVFTQQECLRCHSDPASIKKMQEKAGDPHYFKQASELYQKTHGRSDPLYPSKTSSFPRELNSTP